MVAQAHVIGGGIGGVSAALFLARRGRSVVVHEQAETWGEVGAGLQIGPNGMHILRKAGLEAAVLAHATRPDALEMRDGQSGALVARVPFGDVAQARYGAPYVQLHRADLLEVLVAAAQEQGVEFRFGRSVTAADFPESEVVIAADGLNSPTRAMLNPGIAPAFTGQVAWRALIPRAVVPQDDALNLTRLFVGPGRHAVLYPLRDGTLWNLVAVEARREWTGETWNAVADPDTLRAAFEGWVPELAAMLAAVQTAHIWGLFSHGPLPRWHDNARIALLGDACHPMLPFLAQGAVMAIEDAWCLAQCLDEMADVPAALVRYETLRKPRASRVQARARANGRLYHLPRGPLRWGVRQGMGLTERMPGGLLRPFDWLYRDQSDPDAGQ